VIFRCLAPMVLARGLISPLAWLLLSTGRVERSIWMAAGISAAIVAACVAGLPFGPVGVAMGYSTMMTLLVVPLVIWATVGTPVSARDVFEAMSQPFVAGLLSGLLGWVFLMAYSNALSPVVRLLVVLCLMLLAYACILLVFMRQMPFYLALLRSVMSSRVQSQEK